MLEGYRKHRTTPEQLKHLQENFSNEVPEELVTSVSPDNKFKVRRGWFSGTMATVSNALDEGLIQDPEVAQEAGEFVEWVSHGEFGQRDPKSRTSEKDVQRANQLLDKITGKGNS